MSDTPRTDALIATFKTEGNEFAWLEDLKDLCRELERGQSARPEALHRQVCYGIFNNEGKMHVSENCISDHVGVLDDELYYLQQHEPDDGWKIVPMFIEAFPSPLAQRQEKP